MAGVFLSQLPTCWPPSDSGARHRHIIQFGGVAGRPLFLPHAPRPAHGGGGRQRVPPHPLVDGVERRHQPGAALPVGGVQQVGLPIRHRQQAGQDHPRLGEREAVAPDAPGRAGGDCGSRTASSVD